MLRNKKSGPIGAKNGIIKLVPEKVTRFSSQYGSEVSHSYTATNLAGEPHKYPSYGDFTEACVMVRVKGPIYPCTMWCSHST